MGLNRGSRLVLVISTDLFLFGLARTLGRDSGVTFGFFPSLVLPFVLFGLGDRRLLAAGAILPPVLFLLLEAAGHSAPTFEFDPEIGRYLRLAMLLTALGTLFVWVLLLSLANFRSESRLRDSLARIEHEVTARVRLEAELSRSQKLESLGLLVAGVAHEINNPLSFVVSNLHYLQEELKGDASEQALAEAQSVIDETIAGASRIQVIVRDLKLLAHVESATGEVVDVNEAVVSTLALVSADLAKVGSLVTNLDANAGARCDGGRLGQVILNLAVNAIQAFDPATSQRNQLWVSTRDVEGGVTIVLNDNGSGIAPENLAKIFDPFFTTKPIGTGTGLGLSICHGIVEAARGRLTVESQLGQGSTFALFLPTCSPVPT